MYKYTAVQPEDDWKIWNFHDQSKNGKYDLS